ncbi:uncharacterized protein BXIN_0791 [Babesia sp. Xinjiang]|uniref:uncharacterized protein n=1 Tax=Babesia sp. Xinjiang TaxID=462227 RepID=UPI000A25CDDD|nr:uncharacterized protein BXIN_0791 [Babesia sp. Xinjiang]ORM41320.1 hypothetical protein BXIN_0791 [Babesia sp. Xinjiang]
MAGFKLSKSILALVAFVQVVAGNDLDDGLDLAPEGRTVRLPRSEYRLRRLCGKKIKQDIWDDGDYEDDDYTEKELDAYEKAVANALGDGDVIDREVGEVVGEIEEQLRGFEENLRPIAEEPAEMGSEEPKEVDIADTVFQEVIDQISQHTTADKRLKPYEKIFKQLKNKNETVFKEKLKKLIGELTPGPIPTYLLDRLSGYLGDLVLEARYGPRPVYWDERITWDRHRHMLQSFIKEALKGPAEMGSEEPAEMGSEEPAEMGSEVPAEMGDEVTQEVAVEVPKRESANLSGDNNEPAQKKSWMPRFSLPWFKSPEVAQQRLQQLLDRVSEYTPTEESHKQYEHIFRGIKDKSNIKLPANVMRRIAGLPSGIISNFFVNEISQHLASVIFGRNKATLVDKFTTPYEYTQIYRRLVYYIMEALETPVRLVFV